MYLAVVALTMFVLPILSVAADHAVRYDVPLLFLVGRWFVFWGVGVRLTMAGVRQILQPAFTAKQIFHLTTDEAEPVIRELGVANAATGIVGLLSLAAPSFTMPVAISAAIFFGYAGFLHVAARNRSRNETIAMVSDLFLSAALAIYIVGVFAFL